MFGIHIKPETKERAKQEIKKIGTTFWNLLPWAAAIFTVSAATDAYVTAHRNEKTIQKIIDWENQNIGKRNENWKVVDAHSRDLDILVKNHQELFNQALETTEGKDSAA